MSTEALTWLGIALLVIQSGTFSGLNLALFGVSALRLESLANTGDEKAVRVLHLRRDSNFLLTTILWGNVGTNVLLTLLSDSVLAGGVAFVFSTFVITFGGEIIPQAYFSRNALRMASLLSPMLRFYQAVLFPIAKPSALMLDAWLGKETVAYVPETEIKQVLKQHIQAPESDVGKVEGLGAINFMNLDDLRVSEIGEPIDPDSILQLSFREGLPVFPAFEPSPSDPFLKKVQGSGKRWVMISSGKAIPNLALDAASFLRAALFDRGPVDPIHHCHRPVTVTDDRTEFGEVIAELEADPMIDIIEKDVILIWGQQKRVITGADVLGRLLKGIARSSP